MDTVNGFKGCSITRYVSWRRGFLSVNIKITETHLNGFSLSNIRTRKKSKALVVVSFFKWLVKRWICLWHKKSPVTMKAFFHGCTTHISSCKQIMALDMDTWVCSSFDISRTWHILLNVRRCTNFLSRICVLSWVFVWSFLPSLLVTNCNLATVYYRRKCD